ncbi:MAG: lamin tail domain-containing protein [Candidatus Hodarchaeota archaeon]
MAPEVNPFYGLIPTLLEPINSSIYPIGLINFTWDSLEVIANTTYTWQISNVSNFSIILGENTSIAETPTSTSIELNISLPDGSYFWRVRPLYSGLVGNWSAYFELDLLFNNFTPELTNDTVNPGTGDQYTTFNFTVEYTDLDNNAPDYVNININGSVYPMQKVNALDVDYTDGCIYEYTTNLAPGTYDFYYEASDLVYVNQTSPITGLVVIEANTLAPYLLNPLVTPENGTNTTLFIFTVTYYDDDNNLPQMINITINGSVYNMTKVNVSDMDATDGILYEYATTLAWGSYQFQMNCSDGLFTNSTSIISKPDLNPFNYLSGTGYIVINEIWAGSPDAIELYNYGPTQVMTGWYVRSYDDNADDLTYYIPTGFTLNTGSMVVISEASGTNTATELYIGSNIMWANRPIACGLFDNTGACVDWMEANSYTTPFPADAQWIDDVPLTMSSNYAYRTSDIDNDLASDWTVSATGSLGSLNPGQTGQGALATIDLLSPSNGSVENAGFINFSWSSINILAGMNFTWQISNSSDFSSILNESSGIPETPGTTNATLYVNFLTGTYYWRVKATYDIYSSNWSDYFVLDLFRNEYAPELTSGSVNPPTGDQLTLFNFTVIYTDADDEQPSYIDVLINGTAYPMQKQNPLDVNYTDGVLYECITTLIPGTYNYTFECSDGVYLNSTIVYTGLLVNESNLQAPSIVFPTVTPTIGENDTLFNFTAWYFDTDNNLPVDVNITINSSIFTMTQVNSLDNNATDGILFEYSTTLNWGYYRFQVNCSDGLFTNATGWINQPEVSPFYGSGPGIIQNVAIFRDQLEWGYNVTEPIMVANGINYDVYTSADLGVVSLAGYDKVWIPGQQVTAFYNVLIQPSVRSWLESYISAGGMFLMDYTHYTVDNILGTLPGGYTELIHSYEFCTINATNANHSILQGVTNGGIDSWNPSTNAYFSGYTGEETILIYDDSLLQPRLFTRKFGAGTMVYVGLLLEWAAGHGYGDSNNLLENLVLYAEGTPALTLLAPVNGSAEFTGDINFTWSSLELPVGAVNYSWQISNAEDFSVILDQVNDIPESPTNTTELINVDFPTDLYYWRVRPMFYGVRGNWSDYFMVNLTNLVSPPTSSHPADIFTLPNATNVNITWQIWTQNTPGQYRVLREGIEIQSWQAWTNGTAIVIPINTNIGLGIWNYTLEFNDSAMVGLPDPVFVNVNDIPAVSGGGAINNTLIFRNETGYAINWTITDDWGSPGQYRVLINGAIHVDWTSWFNGSQFQVPVDTNRGFGEFNYTLLYRDAYSYYGNQSEVFIIIHDVPISNNPPYQMVVENSTGGTIDWFIIDGEGTGEYRVLLNGNPYWGWTPWSNDSNLSVPIDTNSGLGDWNYTIQFNNSRGFFGLEDSVIITVNDIPVASIDNTPPSYITENGTAYIIWNITDGYNGSIFYAVLQNESIYVNATITTSGTQFNVTIDTSSLGTWNYTLVYIDELGFEGVNSSHIIIVNDVPMANDLPDQQVGIGDSASIPWVINDIENGAGNYEVEINGSYHTSGAWTSGVPLSIPIDTSALGNYSYTLIYNDSYDEAGQNKSILITVVDIPIVGSAVYESRVRENASRFITWTITDGSQLNGQYRVLRNTTEIIPWTSWSNNTPFNVPINTNIGYGDWNYTLEYNNSAGEWGTPDELIIFVDDRPIASASVVSISVYQNTTFPWITWTLTDLFGTGNYSIFRNSSELVPWTPWTNGSEISISTPTTEGTGLFAYRIRYNDSYNFYGVENVVMVTIMVDAVAPAVENLTSSPGNKIYDQVVLLSCNVADLESGLDSIQLYYSVNTTSSFAPPIYNNLVGNNYTVEIPVQGFGSTIYYYYVAVDLAGNTRILNNSGAYFNYTLFYLDARSHSFHLMSPVNIQISLDVVSPGYFSISNFTQPGLNTSLNLTATLAMIDLQFTGASNLINVTYTYTGTYPTNELVVFFWNSINWVDWSNYINPPLRQIFFQLTTFDRIVIGTREPLDGIPPMVSYHSPDITVQGNQTNVIILWILTDASGGGTYNLSVYDGTSTQDIEINGTWIILVPIQITVNTSIALTLYFTIEYKDAYGNQGTPSTIAVTITQSGGSGTEPGFDIMQFIMDYWYILVGAIAGIVVVAAVASSRKKKMQKAQLAKMVGKDGKALAQPTWMQPAIAKPLTLEEVKQRLKHLFVFHRTSSVCLYYQPFGETTIDPQLIAGFLSAISSFGGALDKEAELRVLEYKSFNILMEETVTCRYALLFTGDMNEKLNELLKAFMGEFESKYMDQLSKFQGDVSVFGLASELITNVFNIKTDTLRVKSVKRVQKPGAAKPEKPARVELGKTKPEERFNLYCPICQNWTGWSTAKYTTGREECNKCHQPLFFVPKCKKCGHVVIHAVKELASWKGNPPKCEKCGGEFYIQ